MDFSQYIPNTQELHAIAAHLPVGLSAVGIIAVFAAILIKTRRDALRWSAAACYGLLAAAAFYAEQTGEDARATLSAGMPKSVWDIVEDHQEKAEYILYCALATAILMIISILTRHRLRTAASVLTVLAALATAVWVGLTGHLGGALVYEHGVGIPLDRAVEWRINPPGSAAEDPPAENTEDLIPIAPIDPEKAKTVSWMNDVLPLFDEVCNECHTPDDLDSELDLTNLEGLLKGGEKYGPSIIPGNPDESTLIKYVRGQFLPQMPEDDMPLLRDEVHMLREWIFAGAKDDSVRPSD